MSLIELAVSLSLAVLLAFGSLATIGVQAGVTRLQAQAAMFTTQLAEVRMLLSKTAGQATRARIFPDTTSARGSSNNAVTTGSIVRLEYMGGPNTPSDSPWQATLEFRSDNNLYYRNQDGNEWQAASNLDSLSFSIVNGMLAVTFSKGGLPATVYIAVN